MSNKALFTILLTIIAIIVFIYLLSMPYINKYLCIGYIGKKGSGKTTQLTKLAINYQKKGYIVYSTEKIVGTRVFDPKKIGFYDFEPNSVILIDEIGIVFPARDFKNFSYNARAWFKLQRHKKCIVIWFTQTWIDCDKSIRDLTDRLYLCHNFFNMWSTYRKVSKILTIGTSKNQDGSESNEGSDFIECFKFTPLLLDPKALEITFIPRWKYFYDTFANDSLPSIEYEFIPVNETQRRFYDNKYARKYFILTQIDRFKAFIYKTYKTISLPIEFKINALKIDFHHKIDVIKYKKAHKNDITQPNESNLITKWNQLEDHVNSLEKERNHIIKNNCKTCNGECNNNKYCPFKTYLDELQHKIEDGYEELNNLNDIIVNG